MKYWVAICICFVVSGLIYAETDLLDLASGAVVLSYTSQYSGWSALSLIDGATKTGWCNEKPNPNTIVIELAGPFQINKLVLDNTGNQESSYDGISARSIDVFGSTTSSDSGYSKIGTFEAAKGTRKEIPLKNARAQWLKFVVLSNWGHKEWTELMELEAYGTPAGKAQQPDISGVYDSNYGPIVLKRSGGSVTGCYYNGDGAFNGTTDGRAMQMEWRQDQGKRFGGLLMVLSSDGKFLNGLWYQNGNLAGEWFGNRSTENAPCVPGAANAVADALRTSGRSVLYGIQFDSDSATLKPSSESTLQQVEDTLKKDAALRVEVEGHTDALNTDEYNLQLSQKRAAAVVDWLVKHGTSADRLSAKGYGKSKPVADNATPQGRALNRRVEIVAVK